MILPVDLSTLIGTAPLNPLGAGQPQKQFAAQIARVGAGLPTQDEPMAKACLSGLWLLFDFLDESHNISQGIHSSTGSFWHGIMHRREPDASNAAYWFERTGHHPVFPEISQALSKLPGWQKNASRELESLAQEWNPFVFIDLCEKYSGSGDDAEILCRQIQKTEWQILFDYCYQKASGL